MKASRWIVLVGLWVATAFAQDAAGVLSGLRVVADEGLFRSGSWGLTEKEMGSKARLASSDDRHRAAVVSKDIHESISDLGLKLNEFGKIPRGLR